MLPDSISYQHGLRQRDKNRREKIEEENRQMCEQRATSKMAFDASAAGRTFKPFSLSLLITISKEGIKAGL